jgi:arylsulfatase A-like enzyme
MAFPAHRPNILLIVADDLGYHDTSLHVRDGGGLVATPNIEAIAAAGVRFDAGYATHALCSPSRSALLTGRHQNRFGTEHQPMAQVPRFLAEYLGYRYLANIGNFSLNPNHTTFPPLRSLDQQGLPPSELTIAELLSAAGYATGLFGKWHLGARPEMVPTKRGFGSQYGFYEAFSSYTDDVKTPGIVNAPLDEFSDRHEWHQWRSGLSAIRKNDSEVVLSNGYLTRAVFCDGSVQCAAQPLPGEAG